MATDTITITSGTTFSSYPDGVTNHFVVAGTITTSNVTMPKPQPTAAMATAAMANYTVDLTAERLTTDGIVTTLASTVTPASDLTFSWNPDIGAGQYKVTAKLNKNSLFENQDLQPSVTHKGFVAVKGIAFLHSNSGTSLDITVQYDLRGYPSNLLANYAPAVKCTIQAVGGGAVTDGPQVFDLAAQGTGSQTFNFTVIGGQQYHVVAELYYNKNSIPAETYPLIPITVPDLSGG